MKFSFGTNSTQRRSDDTNMAVFLLLWVTTAEVNRDLEFPQTSLSLLPRPSALLVETKGFPRQPRGVISPACPEPNMGPHLPKISLKHLT